MKNMIIVSDESTGFKSIEDHIHRTAVANNVCSLSYGFNKKVLTEIEWEAHAYANRHDLHVFDASINIPERKLFSWPKSQENLIFERSKKYGADNVVLAFHNNNLPAIRKTVLKALGHDYNVVIVNLQNDSEVFVVPLPK